MQDLPDIRDDKNRTSVTDGSITPEERKKYFGMQFRLARIEQEKKQQDICNDSNISPYYLSQIERGIGNPSLDMMVRLARSLGKKLKITLE